MTDNNSSEPPTLQKKSGTPGCGVLIGIALLMILGLLGLLFTSFSNHFSGAPASNLYLEVALIFWALFLGVLVLTVRALRKTNRHG